MSDRVLKNRDRYHRMAAFYERMVRMGSFTHFYRAIANAIEDTPGGVVVDVGCGPGSLVPHLLAKVGPTGAVVGTDVSDEMIERARSRAARAGWTNARFERSDVRVFSPEAKASVVVFGLALTTMPEPERCRLDELTSLLQDVRSRARIDAW